MVVEKMAQQDFERAVTKAFWRKILARLRGANNDLLPFDLVRERLDWKGQHVLGLKQVPIEQIVGSFGRYRDFDRAFLPTQKRTRGRWVSIDMAHYEEVALPPVELYKMGEVYFVKDGNHRVSVARERGQAFVDAFVTEIDLNVLLTSESDLDELVIEQEQARFMDTTGLANARPGVEVRARIPGHYERLLEHLAVHRWYLGEQQGREVPNEAAAASWHDHVYMPVVEMLREQGIPRDFPDCGEADLYLWIMEYQGYLRRAYREEPGKDEDNGGRNAKKEVGNRIAAEHPHPPVRRLVSLLQRSLWIDALILQQERAAFLWTTRIQDVRPETKIETTVPGQYDRLLEHIDVHRWYLGEQQGRDVGYAEALASWVDQVYQPLVQTIREQGILSDFPGRTETDLYLWIIAHLEELRQTFGEEVSLEQAAGQFAEEHSQRPVKKIAKVFKTVLGDKLRGVKGRGDESGKVSSEEEGIRVNTDDTDQSG